MEKGWPVGGRRRRHRRAINVHAGILFFPFSASVLEPNFDLRLGQRQRNGQIQSLAHGQVAGGFEFIFQGHQLFVGEGGSRPPGLAAVFAAGLGLAVRLLAAAGTSFRAARVVLVAGVALVALAAYADVVVFVVAELGGDFRACEQKSQG